MKRLEEKDYSWETTVVDIYADPKLRAVGLVIVEVHNGAKFVQSDKQGLQVGQKVQVRLLAFKFGYEGSQLPSTIAVILPSKKN